MIMRALVLITLSLGVMLISVPSLAQEIAEATAPQDSAPIIMNMFRWTGLT